MHTYMHISIESLNKNQIIIVPMADLISNFATTAGFMVGLGVLLFVTRSRRPKEAKTATSSREDDKGRKVKYGSDGKPIHD
jgi:hypothetical protein